MMEDDEWVAEGDLDAAREIVGSTKDADLFLYEGDKHLFVDSSLPDHDEGAATDFLERVLEFLGRARTPRRLNCQDSSMSLNTTALVSNPSWRSFSVTRQPTSPLTVTTSRIRNVSPPSAETETSHCSASAPSRSDSLAGPGVSPASSSR